MSVTVSKFPNVPTVEYEQIRPHVQNGDILLCAGSGFFSKLIQASTRSIWSHVAFILYLESVDRVMILESVEPIGVRTVPLSHYVKNYKSDKRGYPGKLLISRHSKIDQASKKALNRLSKFAIDLFGYPYDKGEIAKIAARIAASRIPFGLFGYKERELKPNREYICSEYAWECFRAIGVQIQNDTRGFISPKDFALDSHVKAIAGIKTRR